MNSIKDQNWEEAIKMAAEIEYKIGVRDGYKTMCKLILTMIKTKKTMNDIENHCRKNIEDPDIEELI